MIHARGSSAACIRSDSSGSGRDRRRSTPSPTSWHRWRAAARTTSGPSRLAEAFAEWLHKKARCDWGYGRQENLSTEALIEEGYRGIRPAPGYPACPDHTEKQALFALLDAENAAGMSLTESCAMLPAASVSGLYFAHPESRYFAVDRITREQVESYATRKGMPVADIERWLAPNLGYDP